MNLTMLAANACIRCWFTCCNYLWNTSNTPKAQIFPLLWLLSTDYILIQASLPPPFCLTNVCTLKCFLLSSNTTSLSLREMITHNTGHTYSSQHSPMLILSGPLIIKYLSLSILNGCNTQDGNGTYLSTYVTQAVYAEGWSYFWRFSKLAEQIYILVISELLFGWGYYAHTYISSNLAQRNTLITIMMIILLYICDCTYTQTDATCSHLHTVRKFCLIFIEMGNNKHK